MTVLEVMTRAPATCQRTTQLAEVARMMVDCNCGAIPVVDDEGHPAGVVTDRDIVVRAIAKDLNPLELTTADVMTDDVVTVKPDTSIEQAAELLERNQIRRLIVTDRNDRVIGVVAQADLARRSEILAGEIVSAVSQPSIGPSAVH